MIRRNVAKGEREVGSGEVG